MTGKLPTAAALILGGVVGGPVGLEASHRLDVHPWAPLLKGALVVLLVLLAILLVPPRRP